jgi:hypothetical protein
LIGIKFRILNNNFRNILSMMGSSFDENFNSNMNVRKYSAGGGSQTNNGPFDITKEHFDLLKCEFCDDHIKRRFLETKEIFYKIFKNFIKFIKLIKNKEIHALQKLIEETGAAQNEFINYRNFVEKILFLRLKLKTLEFNPRILPVRM